MKFINISKKKKYIYTCNSRNSIYVKKENYNIQSSIFTFARFNVY